MEEARRVMPSIANKENEWWGLGIIQIQKRLRVVSCTSTNDVDAVFNIIKLGCNGMW